MNQLTNLERQQIRLDFQDIGDTFHKTPITYHFAGVLVNEFMEVVNPKTTDYTLMGEVTYFPKIREQDTSRSMSGDWDNTDVKVYLLIDDLIKLGLVNVEGVPLFNTSKDFMTINGESFKVNFSAITDAFEKLNLFVVLKGKRQPRLK